MPTGGLELALGPSNHTSPALDWTALFVVWFYSPGAWISQQEHDSVMSGGSGGPGEGFVSILRTIVHVPYIRDAHIIFPLSDPTFSGAVV